MSHVSAEPDSLRLQGDNPKAGSFSPQQAPSGTRETGLQNDSKRYETCLPHASEDEDDLKKKWFETVFFPRICAQEFLTIAASLRPGKHTCRFGERNWGSYNIILYVVFDDGIEWVVKVPKVRVERDRENKSLKSEYATLVFLQQISNIPAPKVHGSSFTSNNPAKTPYYIMDSIPGLPLWQAWDKSNISRDVVFEMLRQLADVRKSLALHTWSEIGSLTMSNNKVTVDKQLSIQNFFDSWETIESRPGLFVNSMTYYANLWQDSWRRVQENRPTAEEATLQWKIHNYLSSILPSYVQPQTGNFALTHTDLNSSNILVDPATGSITGIIDWEFACTLPSQASEQFPLLLHKASFMSEFASLYDDPEAELQAWREFYAKQFEGDEAMQEYFRNIDAAIAFEDILKDNGLATLENLVENCKFLESAETLEKIEIPFPWTSPTRKRTLPPAMDKVSPNSYANGKWNAMVQTKSSSNESSPTTTDGDVDMRKDSPPQSTHMGHDGGLAVTDPTEAEAEMTARLDHFSLHDVPPANGGDDMTPISPSQRTLTEHDKVPAATGTTQKGETATQAEEDFSQEDFSVANGGDYISTNSPSQNTHVAHHEAPPTTTRAERVETRAETENPADSELPTTNAGDDESPIPPSQPMDTHHNDRPTPTITPEKPESVTQTENPSADVPPTTRHFDIQSPISLSVINSPDDVNTTEDVASLESRSLNSFIGRRECGEGLRRGLVVGMKQLGGWMKHGGKAVWRGSSCRIKSRTEKTEKQD